MLPDFQVSRIKIAKRLTEFFEERIAFHSGGYLKDIPRRILHEGDVFTTEYHDGFSDNSELQPIHSKIDFKSEEIITDPEIVFSKLDTVAKDFAFQQTKMLFDKVSDVTEKVGNVTDFRGELTPEKIFEVFEKIEIDFNADGTPRMPTIHVGAEMAKTLPKVFEKIDNDSELKKQFHDIMEKQKKNWYDRTASRKLVD